MEISNKYRASLEKTSQVLLNLVVVYSALPEVGWWSAKNVNKFTQSGKVSLVKSTIMIKLKSNRLLELAITVNGRTTQHIR